MDGTLTVLKMDINPKFNDPQKVVYQIWVSPDCSEPTDRRSSRTGPKKILEVLSVQDLKIAKRTSKDLFFDPGTIIRFFKMDFLEF